jgi:competence protein ComEC
MSAPAHYRLAQSPLLILAAAVSAGVLLGSRINSHSRSALILSGFIVATLGVLSIWLSRKGKLSPASILLCLTFTFTGLTLVLIEDRSASANRISRMDEQDPLSTGDPVEITGTIVGQPEAGTDGFYLTLRADRIRSKNGDREASGEVLLAAHVSDQSVRSDYDALQLRHGARIRVMTVLDRDDDYRNPGVLPFTEFLERQGYDATGVIKSPLLVERLDDERVFLPVAWLYEWRQYLETEFDKHFSPETAGILEAVLLGNRHKVSRAVADRFREGGTFHVLVIAGLHISFIAGLLFLLMKRITRNRVVQFVCLATMLFAYSLAVGAQMPVMRAALVFTLGIFSPLVWRRANSLNVIAAAALVLLVWRPSDLFDPSFQLTFLSVISIVTLAVPIITRMQQIGTWRPTHGTPYPPSGPAWFRSLSETIFWSERAWKAEMATSNVSYRLFKTGWADKLERWHLQRLLRFSTAAVIVSVTVQIGMLPLLVIYFHRLSFASLLLNIFVGVAMAGLALVALAATLLAQFSSVVAAPLILMSEKIEWLMVHAIDPFNRFSIASVRLPHYHGWAASIYVLYFACLSIIAVALFRWRPLRPALITGAATFLRRSHLVLLVAVFVLLLAVIIFHPVSAARADGKLHVDFLDVGQGDSALVTMPDGATLLIDGGGRPNIDWQTSDGVERGEKFERDTRSIGERVVSEYLWARGLDHIDYILPTHADADHIDGLNDVARNFKVRGALVSRTPAADAEYIRFAQTMKAANVPIERIGAGDTLRFGEVAIDVLWPLPADNNDAPWRNNDGTVLQIRYGNQTFLFTADIEKEAERGILNEGADLRSSIVKVAHHGSRTSSTPDFIAATHAPLAIISVGRTSIFGHPNREVVDRWRATGTQVMTTGERGTISVVTDGRELKVSTFMQK